MFTRNYQILGIYEIPIWCYFWSKNLIYRKYITHHILICIKDRQITPTCCNYLWHYFRFSIICYYLYDKYLLFLLLLLIIKKLNYFWHIIQIRNYVLLEFDSVMVYRRFVFCLQVNKFGKFLVRILLSSK